MNTIVRCPHALDPRNLWMAAARLTAALSLQAIKRLALRSLDGQPIAVPPTTMRRGTRYWIGGTLFGLGWALVGAWAYDALRRCFHTTLRPSETFAVRSH